MNKRLFWLGLIYLLFYSYRIEAQVIVVNPALPTDADQVTITFDASKATRKDLLNYTGDVYAHTGVKVDGLTWQHIKGTWGINTTQPKLTRTGTNTYTLTISPSIREFYNVPADKKITQLCFVFRSSVATYKQTEDIFYTVYEQGLTLNISNPLQEKPIYELYSEISIQANSNNSTLLKLFIDNNEVASTSLTSITHNYTADSYGKHWIKAVASNATDTKKDSVYIIVRPDVVTEELPAGVKSGLNILSSNSVTLVLNDPPALKTYCYLIGSFSNWLIDDQYYMKRTPDGKYYWITLSDLDPDQEYIYQYFVDGQIRLADPYCTKTSDQYDQYISATNYPNLIAYPKDKTTGVASTFKINDDSYSWDIENFDSPSKEKLVIYELHIRDFVGGDYVKTAMDSISYLKKLGVNAIELMPISEFQGNDSWGYNPSFYFAPDKAYGTKNDYKALIDECHKQGIAVIMDIVLNHSYEESPLVQMYYNSSTYKVTSDNPWYNVSSPNSTYSWGYDFNHESTYTQQFADSVLTYWLTEFKFDGFRFDFTKGFTNTSGDGSGYDASRIAILKRMAKHIWDVKYNAYVILEHFSDNDEEIELTNYGMMVWGNLNYSYSEATMGYVSTSDFSKISYKNRGFSNPYIVGYMESHDEERIMYKNLNFGNSTNANYNIKNLSIGLNRNKLASLFFLTVPGPKMIWQFGELGYDIPINLNDDRVGRKPIHWEYYNDYNRHELFNTYAQLIRLKDSFNVFNTNNFTISFSGATKWMKLIGNDMSAVVLGNFDVDDRQLLVEFPASGKWYEYFSQDSINISTTAGNFNFEPGEYRLYTSKRIKSHDIFPETINSSDINKLNVNIWPNPNSGNFVVAFSSKTSDRVQIDIFSSIGQKVHEQTIVKPLFGDNIIDLNLNSRLIPGIYLVRIQTGRLFTTKKLIIR